MIVGGKPCKKANQADHVPAPQTPCSGLNSAKSPVDLPPFSSDSSSLAVAPRCVQRISQIFLRIPSVLSLQGRASNC
jgi:hypothetical protein